MSYFIFMTEYHKKILVLHKITKELRKVIKVKIQEEWVHTFSRLINPELEKIINKIIEPTLKYLI